MVSLMKTATNQKEIFLGKERHKDWPIEGLWFHQICSVRVTDACVGTETHD